VTGRHDREVGLRRAGVHPAEHLVAGREPGDPGAGGGHPAGQVAALPGREGGREPRLHRPGADRDLAGVDPGRDHLHQDLAGSGDRAFHVDDVQLVDLAVPLESHRAWHVPGVPAMRAVMPP
jgi:hypothetical protein